LTTSDPTQRRKLDGLDDKRGDIILGGAVLMQQIFAMFDLGEMTISEYALREGVLFDRFGRDAGHELHDLRRGNLLRLAKQLDPDVEHAEHTAKLAIQLFDRTQSVHGLDDAARELLDAAAIVHNVGLFISHASHHKHSYYVIRNSEQLTGFTEHEIELIAVVARYHRKSQPSDKHPEFAALSKSDKKLVRLLAGLLRIAIGLDRRHAAVVRSVRVLFDDAVIRVEPLGGADADVALEVYAARERSGLLASALGVTVEISSPRDETPESN
jgi:exopolyphosphatase/guanosine-5'-triphosphate,3'-diphosphate pyrophosphatase